MVIKVKRWNHADTITPDMMDELMAIEIACFKPELQETYDSKKELIQDAEIVLFAYDKDEIIGEAYCIRSYPDGLLDDESEDANHLWDLFEDIGDTNSIYFMSFAVLPDYRNQSIARLLLDDMISLCKYAGYSSIFTHAKMGASAHLFEKAGGELIEKRSNWFETGENYSLFCIPLE